MYFANIVAPGRKSTPGSIPFMMSRVVVDVDLDARAPVAADWDDEVPTLLLSSFFVDKAVALEAAVATAVSSWDGIAFSLIGVPTAFAFN